MLTSLPLEQVVWVDEEGLKKIEDFIDSKLVLEKKEISCSFSHHQPSMEMVAMKTCMSYQMRM